MTVSLPMSYIADGNAIGALAWGMTEYIGFGIVWLFISVIVFAVVYAKSDSPAIAGTVFISLVGVAAAVFPPEIQKYFLLLIGVMITVLAVKIWKG